MNGYGGSTTLSLFLLAAIAVVHPAAGEEVPGAAMEAATYNTSMAALRGELYRAEDRLFSLFNALNSNDLNDIHCENRAPTGSHIKERVCEAKFVRADTVAITWTVVRRKYGLLLEEMRKLAEEHPDLRAAMENVAEARTGIESLKAERRTAQGG